METKSVPISPKYVCEKCDIKTNNKKDYLKHIMTLRHSKVTPGDAKFPQISPTSHKCNKCNKEYKSRNGLWKHKQSCTKTETIEDKDEYEGNKYNIVTNYPSTNMVIELETNIDNNIVEHNENKILSHIIKDNNDIKNLIIEVVKNNNEFQKQLVDMIKSTTINNNNITNNMSNCNNQTFNLQVFLNETCKDAMNMSDFINSFDLNMNDLERLGQDGYVNTMSRLIINKVRELDVEKRPIHCSDARREIVYIKDDGVWVKDDEDKTRLRTVVNKVGSKNINILYKWQQKHPDYSDPDSPDNSIYLNIMMEIMGGKNTRGNEDKVIKRIIKEVVIDKQQYIR
jgi:hypothetical protein